MISSNNHIQTRSISDAAYSMNAAIDISQATLKKIRQFCLPQFEKISKESDHSEKYMQISLDHKKVELWIEESIEAVKKSSKYQQKILEQGVKEVKKCYSSWKKIVRISKEKFRFSTSIFMDQRMVEWIGNMDKAMIYKLEKNRNTETVVIEKILRPISCYRYAWKMSGNDMRQIVDFKSFISILQGDRFSCVDKPKDKDLVLFLQNSKPVHLGIYQNGKILSKEGNQSPVAFIKSLQDMPPEYGDQVLYFRKNRV